MKPYHFNRTLVHKKLPQSTVKLVLPSNESYESKTGCNRTLATVLWVPLKNNSGGIFWVGNVFVAHGTGSNATFGAGQVGSYASGVGRI